MPVQRAETCILAALPAIVRQGSLKRGGRCADMKHTRKEWMLWTAFPWDICLRKFEYTD